MSLAASILEHPNQLQQGGSADEGLNKRGNHSARVAFLEEMWERGAAWSGCVFRESLRYAARTSFSGESRDKFVTATPYADANEFNRITKARFA